MDSVFSSFSAKTSYAEHSHAIVIEKSTNQNVVLQCMCYTSNVDIDSGHSLRTPVELHGKPIYV
jgi:hypothetical protein